VLMDFGSRISRIYCSMLPEQFPANGNFKGTKTRYTISCIMHKRREHKRPRGRATVSAPGPGLPMKVGSERINELGIIDSPGMGPEEYFPHGTSLIWDSMFMIKGTYQPFKENTVITVEPGI